jgi:hypothetical protein
VLEKLVHFLRNGLFADVAPEFGRYLLHKQFFWVHFYRNQIRLSGDNPYENRIITRNLFFQFKRTHPFFVGGLVREMSLRKKFLRNYLLLVVL